MQENSHIHCRHVEVGKDLMWFGRAPPGVSSYLLENEDFGKQLHVCHTRET